MDRLNLRSLIWGALIFWIGLMMVVDERAGVASIGAGAILLGGAAARRAMGWRAGLVMTIAGFLLLAFGLNDLNGTETGIPLFAVILIAFGALAIGKSLSRSRTGPGGRAGPRAPTITIRIPDDRV